MLKQEAFGKSSRTNARELGSKHKMQQMTTSDIVCSKASYRDALF